ncbi:MAG TPA: dockerin type I domain-containing protein [Planctomycetota bacterium]|nr:dockerin type I domain-containing protein [Planctomycetota bacterium]
MNRFRSVGALVVALCLCTVSVPLPAIYIDDDNILILRGDVDSNHALNLTDVIYLNNFLMYGGAPPPCMNQADINNDNTVNLADPVYLSTYLFMDGPPPPPPGPENSLRFCTYDETPLGCEVLPACYSAS